jgi:hypothetical protein
MYPPRSLLYRILTSALALVASQAAMLAHLDCVVSETKQTGIKAVVTLLLTNNFPQKVESARATIFLFDDGGKVVAQNTRWIIGGTPGKSGLEPKAVAKFYFVLETEKAFVTNRVLLNRIILEGGRVVAPTIPGVESGNAGETRPK